MCVSQRHRAKFTIAPSTGRFTAEYALLTCFLPFANLPNPLERVYCSHASWWHRCNVIVVQLFCCILKRDSADQIPIVTRMYDDSSQHAVVFVNIKLRRFKTYTRSSFEPNRKCTDIKTMEETFGRQTL